MNREIKFRGKEKTTFKNLLYVNEWVYGDLLANPHGRTEIRVYNKKNEYPRYVDVEVDPATVGQFTGLHDAEGREVYEGDVFATNSEEVFQVKYYHGCFYGHSEKRDHTDNIAEKLDYLLHFYECRITGTIHDPKLTTR